MATGDLTVTRRVHFFRISHFTEFVDLLPAALRAIQNLAWVEQGRYLPDATDNSLLSVLPHSFEYPLRLEFGRTRRDNLPAIERRGVKQTLSIAEDAGLIDVCHIVIFANGFVAAEFNRDAPRIRKLGEYLMFKGRNLPSAPRFQRLFERNLPDLIQKMENVRFLELEIPTDNIRMVKQADQSLFSALQAQQAANNSKSIGVYFNSRSPEDGRLKQIAMSLAKIVGKDDEYGDFDRLEIKGTSVDTGKPRSLNLLEDYLVADVDFRRSSKKARSIDSISAFSSIEEEYDKRLDVLMSSVRGELPWE